MMSGDRRLRLILALHLVWLITVLCLGFWWSRLLLAQAAEIATLQTQSGLVEQAQLHWQRTQRMLVWESATFVTLLLACSAGVLWVYSRDLRRSRAVQAFFASFTHELKTPLASIRLQAEAIEELVPPTELTRRLLEDVQRLEAQVERTLELARLESGGRLHPRPLELADWLRRELVGWGAHRAVPVDLEWDGALSSSSSALPLRVLADEAALAIVVRNILDNSLKHARTASLRIRLSATRVGGRCVALEIIDNGVARPSVSPGAPAKLGALFERGAESTGSGVGLYLVASLMRRMRGEASFASADERGGFCVRLKFLTPEAGETESLARLRPRVLSPSTTGART